MLTLNLQTPADSSTPVPETLPAPELVFSRSPLMAEIPDAAYREISQRLGINTICLALAELEEVLRRNTLGVYDYPKVAAYLDEQCRRLDEERKPGLFRSYEWRWHPIREYPGVYSWLPTQSNQVYNKPIPPEVLPTIESILRCYPEALFYVSDIRDFRDPFLAVTVQGADKLHVIERWEEPRFRG